MSGGPDYEHNDVTLFDASTIQQYLANNPGNIDLARLLRVPDGASNVSRTAPSSRGTGGTAPFNAHKGTYVALGVEQANFYPVEGSTSTRAATSSRGTSFA